MKEFPSDETFTFKANEICGIEVLRITVPMTRIAVTLLLLFMGASTGLCATRVLPMVPDPSVIRPGDRMTLILNWDAMPLDADYSVFLHVRDSAGRMVLQGDHKPPFPTKTSNWSGETTWTKSIPTGKNLAEGVYQVTLGLYRGGGPKVTLEAGEGVVEKSPGVYTVGTVRVDSNAAPRPLDSAGPETLDLSGMALTFTDEFDDPLDVSEWGPGTKWIAHTPYNGDFGEARFSLGENGKPFLVDKGMLRIRAWKSGVDKIWRAGLLSSLDREGNGFSQTYGYFEMKAKFPKGPGTWPAFWMLSAHGVKDRSAQKMEFDIVEQYGHNDSQMHTVLHQYNADGTHESVAHRSVVEDMTEGFHRYGLWWDKDHLIWYFDGVEVWRRPTPDGAHKPMYLLLNLALGGGWPIGATPDPSDMWVEYVRAYGAK